MGAIIPVVAAKLAPAAKAAGAAAVLQAARPGICSVYRSSPGFFTNGPSALGRDVGRVISLYMDDLSSDQPLPPPRQIPFNGGQCVGIEYDVRMSVTFRNGSPTQFFTRRRLGAIGGIETRPIVGNSGVNYNLVYAVSAASPRGITEPIVAAIDNDRVVAIVGVTRVTPGQDNCGNPFPSDPPSTLPPRVNFDVPVPDIRFDPTVNVNIPVAIFKPTINVTPQLNVDFNMPLSLGGIEMNFNGSEFIINDSSSIVDVDFTEVNNSISSAQININTNVNSQISSSTSTTNTNITNARNNINNNTDTRINSATTNINNSTSSSLVTTTNSINSNTNAQISSSVTAINNSTNLAISDSTNTIVSRINSVAIDLSASLLALTNLVGLINVDVKLALEFLRRIEEKPDCPEPPVPPDSPDVDDVVKPEEPKSGNNPRIQAVTIVLTKLPVKAQWGGGSAPDKQIAGWFSWKISGWGFAPPLAINWERSTFVRPLNVEGYAYTLTNYSQGFAIEHILR